MSLLLPIWRFWIGFSPTRITQSFLLALSLFATGAHSEEFGLVEWRGVLALKLTGPIEQGTTERFNAIAASAEIAAHGLPILLLDSPGGDVLEALMMSASMRNKPFHTVIPDGANCASACASIIYIAGRYRTIEALGRFGQHSCSVQGNPDAGCNEIISQHAMQHGVSHGSVSAFLTYVPPSDILWLTRGDLDNWGISWYPGSEAVGFQKSEPRVLKLPAQDLWRLDFWGNGWRAFYRAGTDAERELQISLFCREDIPGVLFLMLEIYGAEEEVRNAIISANLTTDAFALDSIQPMVAGIDELATGVFISIPTHLIMDWLTVATSFEYRLEVREPYVPIWVRGNLANSRENLVFAANNCDNPER